MNWIELLSDWPGKPVTAVIEDQAGLDPIASPKSFILHKIELVKERTHLQFFLNEHQFLAVPVFEDESTRLTKGVFMSQDQSSKLNYKLSLHYGS